MENEEEQCDAEYNGETGKVGYVRGNKHSADLTNHREDSVLWQYCIEKHNGAEQHFEMTIVDKVRGDAMKRQILESIRISRVPDERNLNRKDEWNSARIPRVRIARI